MLNVEFELTYNELKSIYSSKNLLCETRYGKIYSLKNDQIINLPCDQYNCIKCRPRLKKELHDKICQQVDSNELHYHMIITFPGNELRKKIPYYKSYKIMNYDWNKLRWVIKNKYPEYKYIIFPRSQADPTPGNPIGFCHFHVIHNEKIPKNWLDTKTKKYTLGYTYLRYNEDVAGYLHNDFYNDNEWIIPFNIKHYRSSRDIKINPGQGYKQDPDNIYFTKNCNLSKIEETIYKKYNRLLPFPEYLYQFTQTYQS